MTRRISRRFLAALMTASLLVGQSGLSVMAEDGVSEAPQQETVVEPETQQVTEAQTDPPATEAPTEPATQAPATEAPTEPATQAPVTEAPTEPATQAPAVEKPTEGPASDSTEAETSSDKKEKKKKDKKDKETEKDEEITSLSGKFSGGTVKVTLAEADAVSAKAKLKVTRGSETENRSLYDTYIGNIKSDVQTGHTVLTGGEVYQLELVDGGKSVTPKKDVTVEITYAAPFSLGLQSDHHEQALLYAGSLFPEEVESALIAQNDALLVTSLRYQGEWLEEMALVGVSDHINDGDKATKKRLRSHTGFLGEAYAAAAKDAQGSHEAVLTAQQDSAVAGGLDELTAYGVELANAVSSDSVLVVNVYADETGKIDWETLKPALHATDQEAVDVTGHLVLINVVAYSQEQTLSLPVYAIKDQTTAAEAYSAEDAVMRKAGRVVYNVVAQGEDDTFRAFKGRVNLGSAGTGMYLVPAGTLDISAGLRGSAFAATAVLSSDMEIIKSRVGYDPVAAREAAESEEAAEKVTEAATEEVTEKVTEAVTEETTEKVTEAVTEEVTEKVTEAVTEETTEKATETATEEVTEKVTEAVTEEITEAATEEETEAVSESIDEYAVGFGSDVLALDVEQDEEIEEIEEALTETAWDPAADTAPQAEIPLEFRDVRGASAEGALITDSVEVTVYGYTLPSKPEIASGKVIVDTAGITFGSDGLSGAAYGITLMVAEEKYVPATGTDGSVQLSFKLKKNADGSVSWTDENGQAIDKLTALLRSNTSVEIHARAVKSEGDSEVLSGAQYKLYTLDGEQKNYLKEMEDGEAVEILMETGADEEADESDDATENVENGTSEDDADTAWEYLILENYASGDLENPQIKAFVNEISGASPENASLDLYVEETYAPLYYDLTTSENPWKITVTYADLKTKTDSVDADTSAEKDDRWDLSFERDFEHKETELGLTLQPVDADQKVITAAATYSLLNDTKQQGKVTIKPIDAKDTFKFPSGYETVSLRIPETTVPAGYICSEETKTATAFLNDKGEIRWDGKDAETTLQYPHFKKTIKLTIQTKYGNTGMPATYRFLDQNGKSISDTAGASSVKSGGSAVTAEFDPTQGIETIVVRQVSVDDEADLSYVVTSTGGVEQVYTDPKYDTSTGVAEGNVTFTLGYAERATDTIRVRKEWYVGANSRIYNSQNAMTFYVALFDSKGENRVSEVTEVTAAKGNPYKTMTFENLPAGTYVVKETDQDGEPVTVSALNGVTYEISGNSVDPASVTVSASGSTTHQVTVKNHYNSLTDAPAGCQYVGQLGVRIQVYNTAGSVDTTYKGTIKARITYKTDGKTYKQEKSISVSKGTSSYSVFYVPLGTGTSGKTVTIYELDSSGTARVSGKTAVLSGTNYAVAINNPTLTVSAEQTSVPLVTITNTPGTGSGGTGTGTGGGGTGSGTGSGSGSTGDASQAVLKLTKKVTYKNAPVRVNSGYYIGIFDDAALSKLRYKKALQFKNASEVTASLKINLYKLSSREVTFYFAEVDKDGKPVESGTSFGYNVSQNKSSITLNESNLEDEVIITNDVISGSRREQQLTDPGSGFAGDSNAVRDSARAAASGSAVAGEAVSEQYANSSVNTRTGDETPVMLYMIILAAAFVVMVGAVAFGRRRKQ